MNLLETLALLTFILGLLGLIVDVVRLTKDCCAPTVTLTRLITRKKIIFLNMVCISIRLKYKKHTYHLSWYSMANIQKNSTNK